jgi:hypothetical protein
MVHSRILDSWGFENGPPTDFKVLGSGTWSTHGFQSLGESNMIHLMISMSSGVENGPLTDVKKREKQNWSSH